MRAKTTSVPENSLIRPIYQKSDYGDCFACFFQSDKQLRVDEVVYTCFSFFGKGFSRFLFRLRILFAKPFTPNTPAVKILQINDKPKITEGSKISFFKVKNVNDSEVLMYIEDSHLDAYFSIIIEQESAQKKVSAITAVYFHNTFGKVYFFIIKPFHKIIIKAMLNSFKRTNNEMHKIKYKTLLK